MNEFPSRTPGRHEGYTVTRLIVDFIRLDDGRVLTSGVEIENPIEALKLMAKWPTGGLAEAGYALLVEAIRREAILGFLLSQTQDPRYLSSLEGMEPEEREEALRDLAEKVQSQVTDLTNLIASKVVQEVYANLK